jgi:hypothetical protein
MTDGRRLESKNDTGDEELTCISSKVPPGGTVERRQWWGLSLIGKNTGSGHVAHLSKKTVIINDEKVAVSSQPPIQYALRICSSAYDSCWFSGIPNYQEEAV